MLFQIVKPLGYKPPAYQSTFYRISGYYANSERRSEEGPLREVLDGDFQLDPGWVPPEESLEKHVPGFETSFD